jgi:hypothetical protein
MRGLLRVGDLVDEQAVFGARRSTTTAIVLSGVRCTITYLLVPILAPFVTVLGKLGDPISIALSAAAILMGISGVRRFWVANHRARWSYTTFIGVVVAMLCVGIVIDIRMIFAA